MINRAVLQGRLTADPVLRTTQSGVSVCSFRVAWSEKYKDNETKLFLQCTAWRGVGDFISRYFVKGQEICVEGKLSTRDWTDNTGQNRSQVELTVDNASFCGPKQDHAGGGYGGYGGYSPPKTDGYSAQGELPEYIEIDGEELPF